MLLPLTFLTIASLTHAATSNNVTNATPVFSEEKTWIENLAVRKSNGNILLATASSAVLYQVDPISSKHEVVHNFTEYGNAIMSITEANDSSDVFLINTMECDIYKLAVRNHSDLSETIRTNIALKKCTAGTGITWRIDLSQIPTIPKQLAKGPDPESLLNGVAALNERTVLMVDQALGGIWAIDLLEGNPRLVIQTSAMNDTSGQRNGVNGIRVGRNGSILYFNNPSQGTLASIPIDATTGATTGEASTIATGLSPDDFEIDEEKGFCYIVDSDQGELLKISLEDAKSEAIVSGLAGPTTARWKTFGKELYVATTGGYDQWLSGNPTVPAVVYTVNL